MKTVTRNYYVSRNEIGRRVLNLIVSEVPCSVHRIARNINSDALCATISTDEKNIPKVERILKRYNFLEREG